MSRFLIGHLQTESMGALLRARCARFPKHLPSEVEERGWGGSEVRKGRRGSGSSGVLKKVNFR